MIIDFFTPDIRKGGRGQTAPHLLGGDGDQDQRGGPQGLWRRLQRHVSQGRRGRLGHGLAAGLGIVDEIILPRETRKRVVALLDAFQDKTQTRLPKKHNNMPM